MKTVPSCSLPISFTAICKPKQLSYQSIHVSYRHKLLRFSRDLHLTTAPSLGFSYPSPSFKIFFTTFLSSVTLETIFHETNSKLICSVALGGTAPPSLEAGFPFSPKPSAAKEIRHVNEIPLIGKRLQKSLISKRHLHCGFTVNWTFSPFFIVFTALARAGQK